MLIILSPAKNMNISTFEKFKFDTPIFINEINTIHNKLKTLNPQDIEKLMKVNQDIGFKSFVNFQNFDINLKNAHALKCYDGLVFKNINTQDFNEKDIVFANNHIRILSGFYGVLTPLTYISPYRLEMGLKIQIENSKNLYDFWQNKIYKEIFKNNEIVINLASKEYTKCIVPFLKNNDNFINVDFITFKNGKYKTLATSAKIARGKMTRFIVKNKIDNIKDLKEFYCDEYSFNEALSNDKNFIFTN